MKPKRVPLHDRFTVVKTSKTAQLATMTLLAGESEGGPDNNHRGSDQWMYVVAGSGKAIVNGKAHTLSQGTFLLIKKGSNHQISNTKRAPFETLNMYVPPAYTRYGDPLPAGRPKRKK